MPVNENPSSCAATPVLPEPMKKKLAEKDRYAIGLSATPVTKGLGKYFDCVITPATTNELIAEGLLVPLHIFCGTEPNMEGVPVASNGEWEEKEAEKAALQVVGDVVTEYLQKGEGKKFIGFAASIAHAQELQRQFLAAGINVATYTADDRATDRDEIVAEFRKSDSSIRGVLSVEALTRGFDVADVEVLILARPLRRALAVLVQMLGRVMRTAEGKTHATVLDHSGNCQRFWHRWNHLFEHGVQELDDGEKKEKTAPEEKPELEPVKCPKCGSLHPPRPACPVCGHEYPKKAAVEHVPGTLKELVATGNQSLMRRHLWPQVVSVVLEQVHGDMERAQKRAQAIYYELTGEFARARVETTTPEPATTEVRNKIKANQIRFAKRRQALPAQRHK